MRSYSHLTLFDCQLLVCQIIIESMPCCLCLITGRKSALQLDLKSSKILTGIRYEALDTGIQRVFSQRDVFPDLYVGRFKNSYFQHVTLFVFFVQHFIFALRQHRAGSSGNSLKD